MLFRIVVAQFLGTAGVANLAQCLCFNLADTFAGDVELLANFLQRVRLSILQPETKADDLLLARGQCVQHFLQLFAHHGVGRHLRRRGRVLILDEVAQMAVLFLANRGFQRHRLLRNLDDFAHLALADAHFLRDFRGCGVAPQ